MAAEDCCVRRAAESDGGMRADVGTEWRDVGRGAETCSRLQGAAEDCKRLAADCSKLQQTAAPLHSTAASNSTLNLVFGGGEGGGAPQLETLLAKQLWLE